MANDATESVGSYSVLLLNHHKPTGGTCIRSNVSRAFVRYSFAATIPILNAFFFEHAIVSNHYGHPESLKPSAP